MNASDQFQKEFLKELKDISKRISEIQTTSGLFIHQNDIQKLFDKFLLWKELNSNDSFKTFFNNQKEELREEKIIVPKVVEETPIVTPVVEKTQSKDQPKKLDFNYELKKPKTYPHLHIDLNDRIGFLNTLFKGDKLSYESFIHSLNNSNLEESKEAINKAYSTYNWTSSDEEFIVRLQELNKNRFE